MERKCRIPSDFWPLLFLLAAVVGLLSTAPMREQRDDFWIRRRFEQALAAFDGEEREFTVFYETCCDTECYQRSSDQLTPRQRQAVQNYVHTLRHYFRPYHQRDGEPIYGGGGVSITINYSLPSGEIVHAGQVCWLETKNGKRVGRTFYQSNVYYKQLIDIFTTRYRKELLNSSEFST